MAPPRRFARGLDALLGDMGTGGAPSVITPGEEYGPLSPEQLSRLGRPLTAAEQKAVNDWHAENARKAAVTAKAPPARSPSQLSRPASPPLYASSAAPPVASPMLSPASALTAGASSGFLEGAAWWQIGLGVVGVLAIGTGFYMAARR